MKYRSKANTDGLSFHSMSPKQDAQNSLFQQTVQDVTEDFDETLYLLNDRIKTVDIFLRDIRKVRQHINTKTYSDVVASTEQFIKLYEEQRERVLSAIKNMGKPTRQDELEKHVLIVAEVREFLRIYQQQVAALITSTDWQSPSYAHSVQSQAGRQTNTIYATVNDYKRDRHEDAFAYERAFVKEYVDNWIKFPVYAYATSSGMAAFTTILNFLLLEKKVQRKVLIGNSIWFQNKGLVTAAFGEKIITVDESDTSTILNIIKNEQPSVLLFDSLANAADVTVPDLSTLIPAIVKYAREETYVVIDNTCLTCMLQPLKYVFWKHSPVRLIVFESLNKYHQFGMDRITAGLIWCYGTGTIKFSDYRAHLGTNIPDISVASLPTPNRKFLHKRLIRHSRNAYIVASRLQSWIHEHPECPFASITYPALPNHVSNGWAKNMAFHGCFFTIVWKEKYQSVPVYNRFLSEILKTAHKRNVDIVGGTSFGLNTTRVYLTALRNKPTKPFVRIAVGTEHRQAIEAILLVFLETLEKYQ